MICSRCGTEIADNFAFCPECGAPCPPPVSVPAEIIPEPVEIAPEVPESIPEPVEIAPEAPESIPEPMEIAPEAPESIPGPVEIAPEAPESIPEPVEIAPEAPESIPEPVVEDLLIAPTPSTCPQCGAALLPESIFCTNCGANTCAPAGYVQKRPQQSQQSQQVSQSQSPIVTIPDPEPDFEQILQPEPIIEPAPAAAPGRTCANCGSALKDGQAFCSKCGTAASAPGKHCTRCGASMKDGQMFCTKCGTSAAPAATIPVVIKPVVVSTPATPAAAELPVAPAPKKKKREPAPVAKVFLRLASVLLCICMCLSLLATVAVLDLRQLTDKENLKRVISTSLTVGTSTGAVSTTGSSLGIDLSQAPLDDVDSLVEYLYNAAKEEYGEEVEASLAQVQEFIDRSTAKDFLADKTASYVSDFINGTNDTHITRREIGQLINENADLIEEVFNEKVTTSMREDVLDLMDEINLDQLIQTEVIETARQAVIGSNDYKIEDLMADLTRYTGDSFLWGLVAINVVIVLLLLLTNWFRISNTLKCTAIPMLIVGMLLSVPTVLLQLVPGALSGTIGAIVGTLIGSIVSLFAPVHYITLVAGIVVLIFSFVAKGIAKLAAE